MISAEMLQDKAALYKENALLSEERFPVDLLPVLPLIPLEYIKNPGSLLDPRIISDRSQEDILQGVWVALSLPATRETFLHALMRSNVFESDDDNWKSRAAEMLLPYMGESLINQVLDMKFEPKQHVSAVNLGRVIIKMKELPDVLISQQDKIRLCTYWVNNLDSQSFNDSGSTNVVRLTLEMLEGLSSPPFLKTIVWEM